MGTNIEDQLGNGIENQLFVWENWDILDQFAANFYNVELIVPIGEFAVGTKFPLAVLYMNDSTLELWNDACNDEGVRIFNLKLTFI